MDAPLLRVRGLTTSFPVAGRYHPVVDGLSFDIADGEVLAVVGESGSGKSMTALSIMGLVPVPPGRIAAEAIEFAGASLLGRSARDLQRIRGRQIAMIFQEPMTSLNPVLTIGRQIGEVLRRHQGVTLGAARPRVLELLDLVGIPAPSTHIRSYPHEFSGGMCQRVMIAMALACNPRLLIADEPTTALDVTVQAQILDLLRGLRARLGMAVMFITHDLGLVAEFADRVLVMYAGRAVEQSPARDIFRAPAHPYTEALIRSMPALGRPGEPLPTIPGMVPASDALPPGCRFAPRCSYALACCDAAVPPLVAAGRDRFTACIRYSDGVPAR
jgi:oligopeptide/dipeptide ABC transporter ATP-binding protein